VYDTLLNKGGRSSLSGRRPWG